MTTRAVVSFDVPDAAKLIDSELADHGITAQHAMIIGVAIGQLCSAVGFARVRPLLDQWLNLLEHSDPTAEVVERA
jgi:hypothetical protein